MLSQALATVAIAAFAVLVALTSANVFFRYVLNDPLTWGESVIIWCFVWMIFAGAPFPLATSTHFSTDSLVSSLPRRLQIVVATAMLVLVLVFCLLVVWHGIGLAWQNRRQIDPALQLPYAIPYAAVPLCFLAMTLIVLRDLAELALGISRRARAL